MQAGVGSKIVVSTPQSLSPPSRGGAGCEPNTGQARDFKPDQGQASEAVEDSKTCCSRANEDTAGEEKDGLARSAHVAENN